MTPSLLWLLIGLAAIVLELAAVAPGVGLLFAGLGALGVGLLLSGVMPDLSLTAQIIWFLGLTAAFAILLWKPMQRWRMPSGKGTPYNNMVGERAQVAEQGLQPGTPGTVRWSGTLMNAELAPQSPPAPANSTVEIVDVRGNTLIVKPA